MKRFLTLLLLVLALGATVGASERVRLVSGAQDKPTPTAQGEGAVAADVPCNDVVWQLDPALGAVQAVPLSRTVTTAGSWVEGCVFVHGEHGWTGLWFVDEQPSAVMLSAPLESELVLARAEK